MEHVSVYTHGSRGHIFLKILNDQYFSVPTLFKKNAILAQRTQKKIIDSTEALQSLLARYQKGLDKVMNIRKGDISELKSFKAPPSSAISVVFVLNLAKSAKTLYKRFFLLQT